MNNEHETLTRPEDSGNRSVAVVAYVVGALLIWSAVIAISIASRGCATQTGVVADSPIEPEQVAPAATQPTQQTAAIAVDSDSQQTMHDVGPAGHASQQDGTVNYVGDRTTYNDPKILYACLVVVCGLAWWFSRMNGYESGRKRRLAREGGARLPGYERTKG